MKKQYIREIATKKGVWTVGRFKGGLVKKKGWGGGVSEGGG